MYSDGGLDVSSDGLHLFVSCMLQNRNSRLPDVQSKDNDSDGSLCNEAYLEDHMDKLNLNSDHAKDAEIAEHWVPSDVVTDGLGE